MQATTEWKRGHIWNILNTVQPHSFGLGISAPTPCFRVLFGKVEQCCISCDQTTGDFKSHHLQAGVSHLCPPPPPFLSAVHEKSFFFFLRALMTSSGGHVPLRPPLGSGTAFHAFAVYKSACLRLDYSLVVERKRCSSMESMLHFWCEIWQRE